MSCWSVQRMIEGAPAAPARREPPPQIVIIACGGRKRAEPSLARDLYIGSYFQAGLKYALSVAWTQSVFVLSAKHGLLGLLDMVEPYDLRMGQAGSVSIETVRGQARARGLADRPALILGGAAYVKAAAAVWPRHYALTSALGEGRRGIGHQQRWMVWHYGSLPPAFEAVVKEALP